MKGDYIFIRVKDKELYKKIKRKSIDESLTIIELTEKALKFYLKNSSKFPIDNNI